ncbi:MAG: hypothetical protein V8K32_08610 [Candidatus Electrothrix gigas]
MGVSASDARAAAASSRLCSKVVAHEGNGHTHRVAALIGGIADHADPLKQPGADQPAACFQGQGGLALSPKAGDGEAAAVLHPKGPFDPP